MFLLLVITTCEHDTLVVLLKCFDTQETVNQLSLW